MIRRRCSGVRVSIYNSEASCFGNIDAATIGVRRELYNPYRLSIMSPQAEALDCNEGAFSTLDSGLNFIDLNLFIILARSVKALDGHCAALVILGRLQ